MSKRYGINMCGRYTFFTEREIREVEDIIKEIDKDIKRDKLKTGEIFPSDVAPVLLTEKGAVKPKLLTWGFPNFHGKQLIINARSETVQEKRLFSKALVTRRCVIPSTGFYEWDKDKKKHLFNMPDSEMLYMAGLYNRFEDDDRFVILTAQANESVSGIHPRMPVIIHKNRIHDWLLVPESVDSILKGEETVILKNMIV